MNEQAVYYSILLMAGALSNAAAAVFVWRQRQNRASLWLFLTCAGAAWWAGTYAIFWLNIWSPTPFFWLDLTYLGVAAAITGFFAFSLEYTDHGHWIRPPLTVLLILEPVIALFLLWTDPWHNLFFAGKRLPDSSSILDGGPVFWVNIIYLYVLMAVALLLLLQAWRRAPSLFRKQIRQIVLVALFPWIGSVVGLSGFTPWPELDLTPLAFTLTGALLVFAFYRYDLLDIMPVARHKLVETLPDGVVVLDEKERVVDVNPAARRMLLLVDDRVDIVVGRPPRGDLWRELADLGRQVSDEEVRRDLVVDAGDNSYFLEIGVSPLAGRGGRFGGRLFMIRDITRNKQLETALHRKNEELEAYARVVAHDLKNPLGVIYGYAEMMQHFLLAEERPETTQMLDVILQTSRKMNSIVDELLLLANTEQADVVIEPLAMNEIVEAALLRVKRLIETSAAEVSVPDVWPTAMGYAPWVEEVWANYISNGLKYGGSPPRLVLGAASQPDGMARFWIRDNGPGIPAALQPRLFQQFSRLEGEEQPGHGLGLSIVKRIITRFGGAVGVESEPGEGALFYFTLPAGGDLEAV